MKIKTKRPIKKGRQGTNPKIIFISQKRGKEKSMQRTVYSTKFTYIKNEIDSEGKITSELTSITVHETDEKRALKKAFKEVGTFAPIKTEKVGQLYVLDDEIFFKHAEAVGEPTVATE